MFNVIASVLISLFVGASSAGRPASPSELDTGVGRKLQSPKPQEEEAISGCEFPTYLYYSIQMTGSGLALDTADAIYKVWGTNSMAIKHIELDKISWTGNIDVRHLNLDSEGAMELRYVMVLRELTRVS